MPSRSLIVGTTQADCVNAQKVRRSLTILNTHATAIGYIKEGGEVSVTNGIPIYPGGYISLTFIEDGEYVWERFVIISDTASTRFIVVEGYTPRE
jgi:hypothetical protein